MYNEKRYAALKTVDMYILMQLAHLKPLTHTTLKPECKFQYVCSAATYLRLIIGNRLAAPNTSMPRA